MAGHPTLFFHSPSALATRLLTPSAPASISVLKTPLDVCISRPPPCAAVAVSKTVSSNMVAPAEAAFPARNESNLSRITRPIIGWSVTVAASTPSPKPTSALRAMSSITPSRLKGRRSMARLVSPPPHGLYLGATLFSRIRHLRPSDEIR